MVPAAFYDTVRPGSYEKGRSSATNPNGPNWQTLPRIPRDNLPSIIFVPTARQGNLSGQPKGRGQIPPYLYGGDPRGAGCVFAKCQATAAERVEAPASDQRRIASLAAF